MKYVRSWNIGTYSERIRTLDARLPLNPIKLFKILAYGGGMDGKHSIREPERACNRDINYMWLLEDEKAPNHSEILILLLNKINLFQNPVAGTAILGRPQLKTSVKSNLRDDVGIVPYTRFPSFRTGLMDENLGQAYEVITADASYESFEKKNQICYIKPQNYAGKCSFPKSFCVSVNSHLKTSHPKMEFCSV